MVTDMGTVLIKLREDNVRRIVNLYNEMIVGLKPIYSLT